MHLPCGTELKSFLKLSNDTELEDLIEKTLMDPVRDLFERPRKDLRGQLVHLGFDIAIKNTHGKDQKHLSDLCDEVCEILEYLHAGSLIVDDIQDGSMYRRGKKSLHTVYGLPIALNAGNWLYFLPFNKIQQLPLSEECKMALWQECQKTLLLGHYGQALDVGLSAESLEQKRIPEVSLATMELKSGALVGLALKMGSLIAGADQDLIQRLDQWGRKIGVALQMFDDLGNVTSKSNPEKRCEDLKMKKLGFILSICAESLSPSEFKYFLSFLSEQNQDLLKASDYLTEKQILVKARRSACDFIQKLTTAMIQDLNLYNGELARLEAISQKLVGAYE